MRCKFIVFAGIITMLMNQTMAGPLGSVNPTKNCTWVSSISIGPVLENAGQTQTINLAPNIEKTYAAANSTQTLFNGEIFIGMQAYLPRKILPRRVLPRALKVQFGLEVAATSDAEFSGNIWDDANSNFNNYTYSYQIQHTRIAAKGVLLIDHDYWVMPWVSLSFGVGFNNAHDFQNTPSIPEAVTMPNFSSSTQTSLAYALGVGMQKALDSHWQIGLGYEFADWGKSSLGTASGQTMNQGLVLNNLYTNGLMFNVTWVA